jgi:LPXTG-motif cell wall-anchored protein
MNSLEEIIKNNSSNNRSTILTYKAPKTNNLFNGVFPVFYNNKKVANVIWSNNPLLTSTSLNNVIHGYLKPNEPTQSNINIPNGLFIGTTWFHNKNTPAGLSVSNSLTGIFNKMFIISIEVNMTQNEYVVNIILNNNDSSNKNNFLIIIIVIVIILFLFLFLRKKNK